MEAYAKHVLPALNQIRIRVLVWSVPKVNFLLMGNSAFLVYKGPFPLELEQLDVLNARQVLLQTPVVPRVFHAKLALALSLEERALNVKVDRLPGVEGFVLLAPQEMVIQLQNLVLVYLVLWDLVHSWAASV